MYKLEVRHHFDAAHFLPGYPGKCGQLHGHRWEVVVKYTVERITEPVNMLVDFGVIKDTIDGFDHALIGPGYVDDTPGGVPVDKLIPMDFPSAEQIAYRLWEVMPTIPNYQAYVEVEVWESPNCMVSYAGYRSVGRVYFQAHDMVGTPDLPGERVDVEGIYERMYAEKPGRIQTCDIGDICDQVCAESDGDA